MKIELIAVGKLRTPWLKQGVKEYRDRLKRFARIAITEVPDLSCPANQPGILRQVVEKEGRLILNRLRPRSFPIALDGGGDKFDSNGLARFLERQIIQGTSDFTFIIGGSQGLCPQVLKKAQLVLSFSDLTFPHQLMRVMLLEQIYRVNKILAGETYHK